MPDFGDYAIIDEVTHHLKKKPEWWWKFKPPTSLDEAKRARFLVARRTLQLPDGTVVEQPPTNVEVAHYELALTFGGTNIPTTSKPVEEGGEALITSNMSLEQRVVQIGAMPHELVLELWYALGDAVPGWGPAPKA